MATIPSLWSPTGVAHGSLGRFDPALAAKLDKERKKGGGGQPQAYDPNSGRYTSGETVTPDADTGHMPSARVAPRKFTRQTLPDRWPQDPDSTFAPVDYLAEGAMAWRRRHGLRETHETDLRTHRIDPRLSWDIDAAYVQIDPKRPISGEARRAWAELAKDVEAQFDFMTKGLGVKVSFVDDDPYPDARSMAEALRRKELRVFSTRNQSRALGVNQYHPLFTDEQNDKFRAIHDAFGHAAIGRGFDFDGEDAAYRSHVSMMTSLPARRAMATETVGQNSYYAIRRDFDPEQRVGLLPDRLLIRKAYKEITVVTERLRLRKRFEAPTETLAEPVTKIIRREGSKWCIYSHDGSKKLGTYDSKEEAEARLRQIEHFKNMDKARAEVRARVMTKHPKHPDQKVHGRRGGGGEDDRSTAVRSGDKVTLTWEDGSSHTFKGKTAARATSMMVIHDTKTGWGMVGMRTNAAKATQELDTWAAKVPTWDKHYVIPITGDVGKHLPGEHDQRTHGRRGLGRKPSTVGEWMANRTLRQGGFTVHRGNAKVPTEGFAVAIEPHNSLTMSKRKLRDDVGKLDAWLKSHKERFMSEPDTFVGGWYDRQGGKVYLDIVKVVPRDQRPRAIRLAQDHNQIAIWSLHDQEEIRTGGTGMAKANDKERFLFNPRWGTAEDLVNFIESMDEDAEGDEDEDEA